MFLTVSHTTISLNVATPRQRYYFYYLFFLFLAHIDFGARSHFLECILFLLNQGLELCNAPLVGTFGNVVG